MARSSYTYEKRQRERAKQEKRLAKSAKRAEAKLRKAQGEQTDGGEPGETTDLPATPAPEEEPDPREPAG